MSTFKEIGEIPEKFRVHKEALILISNQHKIDSIKSLVTKYRSDSSFKNDWNEFWSRVAKQEGGKLSLTTIGLIIGASLGGIGIAAMGSAIGMPLAIVLGLSGFLGGSKFDSLLILSEDKKVSAKISKECYNILESKANEFNITISEYVKLILEGEIASNRTINSDKYQ